MITIIIVVAGLALAASTVEVHDLPVFVTTPTRSRGQPECNPARASVVKDEKTGALSNGRPGIIMPLTVTPFPGSSCTFHKKRRAVICHVTTLGHVRD
eukprot:1717163-Rhodomonas_salina.2